MKHKIPIRERKISIRERSDGPMQLKVLASPFCGKHGRRVIPVKSDKMAASNTY